MITWDELERRRRTGSTVGGVPYSGYLAVVLSLVSSLAVVAIVSKNHAVASLWAGVAAFLIQILIVLFLEIRIVRFGVLTCLAAIILPLGAAILFGI